MDEEPSAQKINGFRDPVMVSCRIERELREEIKAECFKKDVTIQAFMRRAMILMLRKLRSIK